MTHKIIYTLVLVCSLQASQAQWWGNNDKINGNGDYKTETRNLNSYDYLSVNGAFSVDLVKGDEGRITITADENLLDYIITEVDGDKLIIKPKKGYNLKPSKRDGMKITVPYNDLSAISLAGSGDIVSKELIKERSFKTSVSGSGDIELNLDVDSLEVMVTGSGDQKLRGNASSVTYKVTGSGDIYAYQLKSENARAKVTGSGDIELYATKSLEGRITGSGDIDYKGNPKKVDKKTNGSGDITQQ